jgi:hypothetical protein
MVFTFALVVIGMITFFVFRPMTFWKGYPIDDARFWVPNFLEKGLRRIVQTESIDLKIINEVSELGQIREAHKKGRVTKDELTAAVHNLLVSRGKEMAMAVIQVNSAVHADGKVAFTYQNEPDHVLDPLALAYFLETMPRDSFAKMVFRTRSKSVIKEFITEQLSPYKNLLEHICEQIVPINQNIELATK